ncbi:hypothetical protein E2K80_03055 [Rhodophyticola sp. CCM32]|uniref:hypothetical protein n=1 Tax=Rhodophyticola sp. CCM32 TaxID=2916397 RepID=UPI00107F030B|nr:hypothetical protein [Rhodophyticola sp. CCM32]QBX99835.1 hypothetical protein E2K80_03055 [Rhodophyticola sp. CCM32]
MTVITEDRSGPGTDREDMARADRVVTQAMKAFEVTLEVLDDAVETLRAGAMAGGRRSRKTSGR